MATREGESDCQTEDVQFEVRRGDSTLMRGRKTRKRASPVYVFQLSKALLEF